MGKLKDEVQTWRNKRITDVACIGYICLGLADPRLLNAEGKSALDLAATKHPEIIDQLDRQVKDLEHREELEEAEEGVHEHARDMDSTTGLFLRDRYFMRGIKKQ